MVKTGFLLNHRSSHRRRGSWAKIDIRALTSSLDRQYPGHLVFDLTPWGVDFFVDGKWEASVMDESYPEITRGVMSHLAEALSRAAQHTRNI